MSCAGQANLVNQGRGWTSEKGLEQSADVKTGQNQCRFQATQLVLNWLNAYEMTQSFLRNARAFY